MPSTRTTVTAGAQRRAAARLSARGHVARFSKQHKLKLAGAGDGDDPLEAFVMNVFEPGSKTAYKIHQSHTRNRMLWNCLGMLAGLLSLIAFIPQIVVIIEHESACDLSMLTLVGLLAVQVLWFAYGWGFQLPVTMLRSFVGILVALFIIVLKDKYDSDGRCELQQQEATEPAVQTAPAASD